MGKVKTFISKVLEKIKAFFKKLGSLFTKLSDEIPETKN